MGAVDEQQWPLRTGLTLGHLLGIAGLAPGDVLVVRHTHRPGGLAPSAALSAERLRTYTRGQAIKHSKVPAEPPPWWLVFIAEGKGRYSRLAAVYENHGEVESERKDGDRFFDLRDSDVLDALVDRLVVEWPVDTRNWAKRGDRMVDCRVEEIALAHAVPFPGYEDFTLTYAELKEITASPAYRDWQTALRSVNGIYLIADHQTGKQYVGQANSRDGGVLSRWREYADLGHGDNKRMKDLYDLDPTQPERYRFSLLRTFASTANDRDIDRAEAHYKRALLTRDHGLNAN